MILDNKCYKSIKSNDFVVKDRNLTIGAKGLYFYIQSMEDKEFPSRKEIALDLKISNVTLGKYLKELKDNNYLECKQKKRNGRFLNNVYFLKKGIKTDV